MSSFKVTCVSHVPGIQVSAMPAGKNGEVIVLIENNGNRFVTERPRHLCLLPAGESAAFDNDRPMFEVPEGCTQIQVDVGIGEMRESTNSAFLGAEISGPGFKGDQSLFPRNFDCGPFVR